MAKKKRIIYELFDGTRVPGVTTIINVLNKPALLAWANRIGLEGIEMRKYVDEKADIGTLAHAMAVSHLKGELIDTSDYSQNQIEQAKWAVGSFFNWLDSHKIELIWAERPLVSHEHFFGGKPDVYAKVAGRLELIDFKTGNGIWPEHIIQVAGGYRLLMKENDFEVNGIRILNIPRTDNENWGELIVSDHQINLNQQLFLSCLRIYYLQKEIKNSVTFPKKKEKIMTGE